MNEKLLSDAVMLWTVVDPIGTLALFAALTGSLRPEERRRVALRATFYSAVILLGAVVVGQILLDQMGIQLISLEVAGGIILFIFGLRMLFGDEESKAGGPESGRDLAVFPLAVPSIAGPGTIMAAVILTDNDRFSVPQQMATAGVLVGILGATCVLMLLSGPVMRVLGKSGAAILVKVMGMILAALAVELVMDALGAEQWVRHAT
jgi:multiple antibiotic resistance protein